MDLKAQHAPRHRPTLWAGGLVCHTPALDCHNMADSKSHRKQHGTFCIYLFFFLLRKRWKCWICWNTGVLQTLFLHFPSTPKFCQNQLSCSKYFYFCQQNPSQQNTVLSKRSQEGFMSSLVPCTAVTQEEGTRYKFSTSWQQPWWKSFHSKAPRVTPPFEPPCEDL